jgi:AraC-like DNA-binding protein
VLGASARRLHDVFRAALGMSLHTSLTSRCLLLARRALRRPGRPARLADSR